MYIFKKFLYKFMSFCLLFSKFMLFLWQKKSKRASLSELNFSHEVKKWIYLLHSHVDEHFLEIVSIRGIPEKRPNSVWSIWAYDTQCSNSSSKIRVLNKRIREIIFIAKTLFVWIRNNWIIFHQKHFVG